MALTPFNDEDYSLFSPFDAVERQLSKRLRRDSSALSSLMRSDLIESENDYQLHADLPGIDASDLNVTIEDRVVTVQAERKNIHESKTDKVHTMERSYGKVHRSFKLPADANVDDVHSEFKNGVLKVTFPKLAEASTVKKIPINIR